MSCSTSSIIDSNVSIAFAVVYGLALLIVSTYSFHFLMKYNTKFQQSRISKQILLWLKDLWKRKKCYIPIITHLFDQVTDISVAIQFGQLATTKYHNNWAECGGLNIWYLFIITIGSMVVYRMISAFLIFQSSKSLQRLIFQLLDFELFRALYINYVCDKTEPCDPQKWITAMEASLESTPQALVQMIYLVKTNTFTSSPLVVISLFSSIWSIISKLVSDDKVIVTEKAKEANFQHTSVIFIDLIIVILVPIIGLICCPCFVIVICYQCCAVYCTLCEEDPDESESEISKVNHDPNEIEPTKPLTISENFENESKAVEKKTELSTGVFKQKSYKLDLPMEQNQEIETRTSLNADESIGHFEWISWYYVLRVVWRVLDVSSLIFIRSLCWLIVGGTALTVIMCFEGVVFLFVCYHRKQWELLFGIAALVPITEGWNLYDKMRSIHGRIFFYRTISNWILMILMSIWISVNFECASCVHYDIRHSYLEDPAIFSIFIYSWISSVIMPCVTYVLTASAFKDKVTLSRTLDKMIQAENYGGILELQLYNGHYFVFDHNANTTLLMLAFKEKRVAIVSYLLKKTNKWDQYDNAHHNILDHYMSNASEINLDDIERSMLDSLIKVYQKYPYLTDRSGKNAFLCGCSHEIIGIVTAFEEIDSNSLILSKDGFGATILDFYLNEKVQIDANTLYKMYEKAKTITDKRGRNIPLCIAALGDVNLLDAFLKRYEDNYSELKKQIDDSNCQNLYDAYLDSINSVQFYVDNPECLELNGSHLPFFHEIHSVNTKLIASLIQRFPEIVNLIDDANYNILDYYLLNEELLSNELLLEIYKENKAMTTSKQQMTIFLCACYHGNIQLVEQIIDINGEVLKETNVDGYNAVSIAKMNNHQHFVSYFEDKYDMKGEKPINRIVPGGKVKILFLGAGQVGKSTIFKQVHHFLSPYTEKDRAQFKDHIYEQIIDQMKECLEWIDIILNDDDDDDDEDVVVSQMKNHKKDVELSENGKKAAEKLNSFRSSTRVHDVVMYLIETLWKEKAVRFLFERRALLNIVDSSAYFWDDIRRISQKGYIPNFSDIIHVSYRTTGIVDHHVEVRDNVYHMFDTGGQRSERKKWIHVYPDTTAVIYVASLNSYDEMMFEDNTNAMQDQINLFSNICNSEYLENSAMICFLNKTDLFTEKVKSVPITVCECFADYTGSNSFEESSEYIKNKFEECNKNLNKSIFIHLTCAIDTPQITRVIAQIQQSIIDAATKLNNVYDGKLL